MYLLAICKSDGERVRREETWETSKLKCWPTSATQCPVSVTALERERDFFLFWSVHVVLTAEKQEAGSHVRQ